MILSRLPASASNFWLEFRLPGDGILAIDLGSGLIDTEMGSCHFDVDRVLFDGGEPGTWKQCLQLQRDGARAKTQ